MFIYKITNNINGKIYIGQTILSIFRRFKKHKRDANNGSTTVFHNALRKYGNNNFTVEEIGGANSKSELNYMEIFYIHKYNSLHPNGYNLALGQKVHKRTKDILKKRKLNKEVQKLMTIQAKKVTSIPIILEKNGNIIKLECISDCKDFGICPIKVSQILNGTTFYRKLKGYDIRYANKDSKKRKTTIYRGRVSRLDRTTGEIKIYNSLKDVALDGFSSTTICKYIRKGKPNRTNYEWNYIDNEDYYDVPYIKNS